MPVLQDVIARREDLKLIHVEANEENKHLFPEFVEFLKSSGAAIPRKLVNSRYTLGSFTGGRNQKKRKNIC